MDTVGSDVSGYLPILEDLPPRNEDGVGGMHMYMPWWLYKEQKAGKMPFARGYHIEFGGGRGQPGAGELGGSHAHSSAAVTASELKTEPAQDLRLPTFISAGHWRNDPQRKQLLRNRSHYRRPVGIPVLRFHASNGARTRSCKPDTCRRPSSRSSKLRAARSLDKSGEDSNWGISKGGGEIIHEVGSTQNGRQIPKTLCPESVLPGLGCAEPVHHRRRALSSATLTRTPRLSIYTALGWRHVELHRRSGQRTECEPLNHVETQNPNVSRRNVFQILGSAPAK